MKINAVFEGGGVKGISLAGAVQAAENYGFSFHRVAGTSSGSVVAALIAAGYSAEEMRQFMMEMPFSSFLQRAPIFQIKWIGPAMRLLLKKGLYSGERLEYWIHQRLLEKGVRTFGDIKPGRLRIIASDISNGRLLVLPDDMKQYGIDPNRFLVSRAVRMSTSIPYFFDPVIIRQSFQSAVRKNKPFNKQFSYIVDGGLLSNFPLWLFDEDAAGGGNNCIPTIGFQMVGKKENHPHRIGGLLSMLQAIFGTMMSAHDQRYIEKHNQYRTIKIPTLGIGTTDFALTLEQSMALFASGLEAGIEFFKDWDFGKYKEMFKAFHSQVHKI
ncbi:patatin-like phospholipase family protein [Paenibacillus melissococcoides]|uniref:Patatin-like phospholipase family protein n=1 Tax=Paenibacillus melissococcoides TaxID=2912268 RepID=A0ABM9G1L6_9BACL|nr:MULTISPECIES: patatin-like phospholipase family protein [Paenibacillus]MEB9894698.1 patatin-like phospholipase family protein [Bacillus cereus]CAH8245508.1 patatin-like phospholipase family protein [Paenibacillus melissococcoides]CAH8711153.1 patatin-like phospholipase family protein [Paenibacillus melissococcoides]CAH8711919.1 patatin-like phospholipase family protein [Paenibacillus melissococcoides]GIO78621.1 phospholipase [Paenibacillus dendritiformis]